MHAPRTRMCRWYCALVLISQHYHTLSQHPCSLRCIVHMHVSYLFIRVACMLVTMLYLDVFLHDADVVFFPFFFAHASAGSAQEA